MSATDAGSSRLWLGLALAAVMMWLMWRLAPVLMPFLCSALLAYLGDPLVDRLQRWGLPRTVGVICVFIAMLLAGVAALFVLVPALQRQLAVIIARTPQIIDWLQQDLLPAVSTRLGVSFTLDADALRQSLTGHWQEVGGLLRRLVSEVGQSGQWMAGWLGFLLLVPVVTFYLLRDWDVLVQHLRALLPRATEPRVVQLAGEIDAVLAEFLRGQLAVMGVLALFYVVGLWVAGIDLAFAIGLFAGAVSFVPYLGVIVGVLLAGVAALLQFHDAWHLCAVLGVFGAGQLLEGMVLSPWLVGERIGLHPVAVIFAVMAGGQLFGFAGVLLALPVAAAVVVLLRHVRAEYLRSALYGDGGPPAA